MCNAAASKGTAVIFISGTSSSSNVGSSVVFVTILKPVCIGPTSPGSQATRQPYSLQKQKYLDENV